jgi:HlyD family secretion protein
MSETQRRGKLLRGISEGLAVLLLLILLMFWLSGTFLRKVQAGPPVAKSAPPAVSTATVELHQFPLIVNQAGTVRSQTQAQLASRIMAQVKEILVREGTWVEGPGGQGEAATLLARLDDRDIQARVHQAQSQAEAADRAMQASKAKLQAATAQREAASARRQQAVWDYQRYDDLYRNRAATGQQLQQMRAQKDVAEAQVQAAQQEVNAAEDGLKQAEAQSRQVQAAVVEAQTMLSYTFIRAPFSGRVIRKMVDVGDMVTPGQSLFLLDIASSPQLHAYIAESLIPHLQIGQTLVVEFDAISTTVSGSVVEIVPLAEPSSRSTLVKISLPPNPAFVSGLYGRVGIPRGQYSALVIPAAAVERIGQIHMVSVLDAEGYPHRQFVALGKRHDSLVEILTGLQDGQKVVVP